MNSLNWQDEFKSELAKLGKKIREFGMRVSMHPGQYTVLNSPNMEIVKRAVVDLEYHCSFLDALGVGSECKLVLHIGGVYDDRKAAVERFVENFELLNEQIKSRLVIENDDKNYTVEEVLLISKRLHIPVVFDNLHNLLNPSKKDLREDEWLKLCKDTWKEVDGVQKIHYSQASKNYKSGAHSGTIHAEEFLKFYNQIEDKNTDIMLEVKDKNISAIKCIYLVDGQLQILALEKEWARYKYVILSRDVRVYNDIRELLKNKNNVDALGFYTLIEEALGIPENKGAEINAAAHIWGYVSDKASAIQKNRYNKLLSSYSEGGIQIATLKNHLLKCAVEQDIEYLINSYYFYL